MNSAQNPLKNIALGNVQNALPKLTLRWGLDPRCVLAFSYLRFCFFFQAVTFDYSLVNNVPVHYSQVPQTSLFSHFFIKNGFHDTIRTFKNYFAIVFLVFSKNKLYPNEF